MNRIRFVVYVVLKTVFALIAGGAITFFTIFIPIEGFVYFPISDCRNFGGSSLPGLPLGFFIPSSAGGVGFPQCWQTLISPADLAVDFVFWSLLAYLVFGLLATKVWKLKIDH